jgi:exodeoxyribonuclease V alpha subunit
VSVSSQGEVLSGLVERVTFHNSENGFCVLRTKARGRRDSAMTINASTTYPLGVDLHMVRFNVRSGSTE